MDDSPEIITQKNSTKKFLRKKWIEAVWNYQFTCIGSQLPIHSLNADTFSWLMTISSLTAGSNSN
jgi:hypothetical protein